jgi:hypothetical protein
MKRAASSAESPGGIRKSEGESERRSIGAEAVGHDAPRRRVEHLGPLPKAPRGSHLAPSFDGLALVMRVCSPATRKGRAAEPGKLLQSLAGATTMNKGRDKLAGMLAGLQGHGLSLPEIGKRTNISKPHLYRLAAGDIRSPSYETFSMIERLTETVVKSARPKAT